MDRIIYTSMTGAGAAVHRQSVLSNNLANVNTTGFKKSRAVFEDLMYYYKLGVNRYTNVAKQ